MVLLLQFEAVLSRTVDQYAGHPEEYAVKLKVPTDGGLCGPYNGRSYDGLYALKGGGPRVWPSSGANSMKRLAVPLRLYS